MSFSYRIASSTVHSIIISTCEAIWNKLSVTGLPQPTEEDWKKILDLEVSVRAASLHTERRSA
jgi:hypothetical protein